MRDRSGQRHLDPAARAQLVAEIEAGIALARDAFERGDWPRARLEFEIAADEACKRGVLSDRVPELFGMAGRALQRAERWAMANAKYERAAEEAKRLGLPVEELRWLGEQGALRLENGYHADAARLLERSVALGRRLLDGGADVADELSRQLGHLAGALEPTDRARAGALLREAYQVHARARGG